MCLGVSGPQPLQPGVGPVPEQSSQDTQQFCAHFSKGLAVIDLKTIFSNRKFLLASSAKILVFTATAAAVAHAQSLDRISCVAKTYTTTGTDTCRAFLTTTNSTHLYIALS